MSMWSKWAVVLVVLAIVVPMAIQVMRRLLRGEPFRDSGRGFLLPPSGPDIGAGGS